MMDITEVHIVRCAVHKYSSTGEIKDTITFVQVYVYSPNHQM